MKFENLVRKPSSLGRSGLKIQTPGQGLKSGNPASSSASSSSLSSPELSDTKVYEPYIRAIIGTATQFCKVGILKSGTTPIPRTIVNLRVFVPEYCKVVPQTRVAYRCVVSWLIDSGLVGSTDFYPGRGTTRAEDAQGTPTQSRISL